TVCTPMLGRHQATNFAFTLLLLDAAGTPYAATLADAVRAASSISLPGRFQREGRWIFDVAHNPDGARTLASTLSSVEGGRGVARRYAFVEYDGPPLEPLELYTRKSGEEIVGQLYNFVDKGGREVALRPEMTPTVARMVGARANALRKPVRWFSMPQLFRYERQQKGRLREHYQLNVDIFGASEVAADAELVSCAVDIMRAFGLSSRDV